MSKRTMLPLAPVVLAGLLAGCANLPWQPPAYETAIKRYYEVHASEKNGQCLAPYIDGFTSVDVVEDTSEQMVVNAGYLFRDWVRESTESMDDEGRGSGGRLTFNCVGYNQRNFVLARTDDTLQVTEMSGPRRN